MVLSSGNKLKVFQLIFSDPARSFYSSGEKLSGCVELQAAQLSRLAGLRVTAAGCARVEHRGGKNRRNQEVEYLKYEETIRLEEQLSRDADGCFLLPPGKSFRFQFGFELPASGRLVSSYKGKFGCVRYYVRAQLDRPTHNALQCEREFEVEEPLDTNIPDLMAPAAASKQKRVTCMFIPDGQVCISAQIDRQGFCEGEEIHINAKFENTCSRIVVPKAAIIAKHSYLADGHTKVSRQKLCAVRGNHIISGMCDMWQGKSIRVPKLPPSMLGCDLIKVHYALMIYLHIPGSEKLTLELPLVIGTVPFSGVGSRTSSVSSSRGGGSLTGDSWATLPPSNPPSYSHIHRALRGEGTRTSLVHTADRGLHTPLLQTTHRTPLLFDCDDEEEEEGGLFMRAPETHYPPPPAYTEVDEDASSSPPVVQVY